MGLYYNSYGPIGYSFSFAQSSFFAPVDSHIFCRFSMFWFRQQSLWTRFSSTYCARVDGRRIRIQLGVSPHSLCGNARTLGSQQACADACQLIQLHHHLFISTPRIALNFILEVERCCAVRSDIRICGTLHTLLHELERNILSVGLMQMQKYVTAD